MPITEEVLSKEADTSVVEVMSGQVFFRDEAESIPVDPQTLGRNCGVVSASPDNIRGFRSEHIR